ncbi:MAG: P44/Msp2 family outer membrane protein [Wolbachia endosymbiont of Tyrophagus putrescentiae]|nr:P44/Msp2 family outer membrane protein [Wolbachia endosymbiont of Tyrophagus putrescentiae]
MNKYKKIFSATALATLLSLSHSAFSEASDVIDDEVSNFHVRVQYSGPLSNWFNTMDGNALQFNGSSGFTPLKGFSKDGKSGNNAIDYKPNYKSTWKNGNVAVGYTMEGIKFELEGFYADLDVDGSGYKKGGSGADKESDKPENAKRFGTSDKLEKATTDTGNTGARTIGDNEGFSHVGLMVNAQYDLELDGDIPVTPYVGAGVGVARTKFVGKSFFRPAYQARAGVAYTVAPGIKLYGGYRFLGLYGSEFKDVELQKSEAPGTPAAVQEVKDKQTLKQDSMLGTHGLEAGVAFHF